MELLTDERAQAIQIGAVLLFGVLIVFLSIYQAFVVPNQNEEVEFNHNEDLQQQLTELRSNVILMPGSSSTRAASLDLGVRYPSRAIFVNPGPPSGTFRTVGTADAGVNVTIHNASAVADEGETGDFWNGSTRSYNTGSLEYQPGYNLYANAPRTVYEHSVLYNSFDGTDVRQPITEQTLVDGNRITLIAVNGSVLENRVDTMSVDVRPVSTRTRTVTVDNASGDGPITLELPTGLTADEWADLLADEDRVEDVRPGDSPDVVEIELAAGEYQIELAKVGVGTGVTETDPAYLTDVSGDGRTIQTDETQLLTVEVRDPFNRPYRDVTVNASAEGGTFTGSGTDQVTKRTDSEGRITVEYKGLDAGSNALNFSIRSGYEPDAGTAHAAGTTENVTMTVTVESPPDTGGSGGQVAYNATWQTPTGAGITCTDDSCVVDQNARGGDDLTLTMATDPSAADADVEFAVNDTGTAAISSSDDRTASDGTASTTLSPLQNGTVYTYTWSGGSGDRLQVEFRNVTQGPFFDVTIDSANSTVTPGDDVVVEYTVENTGGVQDTQDIVFDVNGTQEATESGVTLASGATFSGSFTYTTGSGDTPQITTTISSDNDSESRTVTVNEPAFFDMNITGTNSPVVEGDDLEANITVENTGDLAGTQDISLKNFNDDVVATNTSVQLGPGESTNFNLTWSTSDGDAGSGQINATSEDDFDTETVTIDTGTGLEVSRATDIIPFAAQQQQTFKFSLADGNALEGGETVKVTLDDPHKLDQNDEPIQVSYTAENFEVVEGPGAISNENTGSESAFFTYQAPDDGLGPDEDVVVWGKKVKVGDLADQNESYTVRFNRSDTASFASPTFSVDRDGRNANLTQFAVENLSGTRQQDFNITFEPANGGFEPNEWVTVELVDAADDIDFSSENQALIEGQGETDYEATTPRVRYQAPDSGFDGTVTIQLQDVEPTQENVEYIASANRGTAGTVDTNFTVTEGSTGFSSSRITDLVPHADGQQQTITFTLSDELAEDDSVRLRLNKSESPDADGVLDYNADPDFEDGVADTSVSLDTNGNVNIYYGNDTAVPAGTTVEMRVGNLDVGEISAHQANNPYVFNFTRSDFDSRNGGVRYRQGLGAAGAQ